MNFDPAELSNFFLILTAWAAAFLAALWLSLVFWTYRDIKARARDPLSRILAVLVVAVLFLPGIIIYLILRPAHTLEDEYQHSILLIQTHIFKILAVRILSLWNLRRSKVLFFLYLLDVKNVAHFILLVAKNMFNQVG